MVNVLGERRTLDLVYEKRALARFGDGELKLIHGEDSLTERWTPRVAEELREILHSEDCIVGMPHARGLRSDYWRGFLAKYAADIPDRTYGSSFVSRGDETAVWWNRDFRMRLRNLWQWREVVLVTGGGSLTPEMMRGAKSVRLVTCPPRDAAQVVDDMEIPDAEMTILCCGAAGTILANRLGRKGKWAIDLGYVGKFLAKFSLPYLQLVEFRRARDSAALHRRLADPYL